MGRSPPGPPPRQGLWYSCHPPRAREGSRAAGATSIPPLTRGGWRRSRRVGYSLFAIRYSPFAIRHSLLTRPREHPMSIEIWLAFAAASAVLLVIPGPTILLVVSYAL